MNQQQARQLIQLVIEALAGQPMNLKDDEVTAVLRGHGLSADDADRVLALLPIAFGRAVLQQMGVTSFSDGAFVYASGAKPIPIRLSAQPVYAAGVEIGVRALHHGPASHAFGLLAARSGEVSGVMDAIDAGDKAADTKIASPGFAGYAPRLFVMPPWWRRPLF